jgi:hypothetical protein
MVKCVLHERSWAVLMCWYCTCHILGKGSNVHSEYKINSIFLILTEQLYDWIRKVQRKVPVIPAVCILVIHLELVTSVNWNVIWRIGRLGAGWLLCLRRLLMKWCWLIFENVIASKTFSGPSTARLLGSSYNL